MNEAGIGNVVAPPFDREKFLSVFEDALLERFVATTAKRVEGVSLNAFNGFVRLLDNYQDFFPSGRLSKIVRSIGESGSGNMDVWSPEQWRVFHKIFEFCTQADPNEYFGFSTPLLAEVNIRAWKS